MYQALYHKALLQQSYTVEFLPLIDEKTEAQIKQLAQSAIVHK